MRVTVQPRGVKQLVQQYLQNCCRDLSPTACWYRTVPQPPHAALVDYAVSASLQGYETGRGLQDELTEGIFMRY